MTRRENADQTEAGSGRKSLLTLPVAVLQYQAAPTIAMKLSWISRAESVVRFMTTPYPSSLPCPPRLAGEGGEGVAGRAVPPRQGGSRRAARRIARCAECRSAVRA